MIQTKGAKYAKRITYHFFDLLSLLYLLDYISLSVGTQILEYMTGFVLKLNHWCVFRWTVVAYIGYRVVRIAWHRHRIQNRLKRKLGDLLDKHGRLNEKLKITPSPAISTEEMTKFSVSQLREQLLAKKITSVELIDAYQRRALDILRSKSGCIGEIVFDADVYAILADSQLESPDAKPISPLHGIPVGVQEFFPIRGYDHTMGYISRANKPADEDCALVAALKRAGAIPFILTNFRQKFIGVTSENPIFGRTKHPTHPHRSCVSGDAVLLAHHGAPLSIAADILGDARLAAASCGMAGFKPTTGRMSQKGLDMPIRMPRFLGVVGSPICYTTNDVADVFRSLWASALFAHDSSLCPIPFDESKFVQAGTKKLTIGFYTGFPDLLPASPAVERVLQETRRMLENQGHTIVDFCPPDCSRVYSLFMSLLMNTLAPETLKVVYKEGHGDILVDYKQRAVHAFYSLPGMLKKLLAYPRALRKQRHYPVVAQALRGMVSNKPYVELEYEASEYIQTFFDSWDENKLDCLLCPVSPLPTLWDYSSFTVVNSVFLFTALYNLLGCPAGTVQAGRVEQGDINVAEDSVTAGPHLRRSLMFAQQLDASEGLPVNVQVVAKPWNDELAMGLMQIIEKEMQKK